MEFTRKGSPVTRVFKEKKVTIELEDKSVLFENYIPALMSLGVRAYDKEKGGQQTLPVLILPGVMEKFTLELKEMEERSIGGKDMRFKKFLMGFPGVDITVWANEENKIFLADVPSQNAVYVRDGFEIRCGWKSLQHHSLLSHAT